MCQFWLAASEQDRSMSAYPATARGDSTSERAPTSAVQARRLKRAARGSVLDSLAVMASTYVRRAGPGEPAARADQLSQAEPAAQFVPCRVQDIVTIDNRGRVAWPSELDGVRSFRTDGATIRAVLVKEATGRAARIDQRRRLQVPFGVLAAAGMRPGDRVVIAVLDDENVLLAMPSALAIDRGGA